MKSDLFPFSVVIVQQAVKNVSLYKIHIVHGTSDPFVAALVIGLQIWLKVLFSLLNKEFMLFARVSSLLQSTVKRVSRVWLLIQRKLPKFYTPTSICTMS